ncbi:DUF4012 domain-containing protein, partial [Microbacterium sp. Bi128]|uniref:DUF4012 domain-containing protein n=1 Tax=Microbacterium sp. Bi128 TaxID=2821115 RepID=UPI001E605F5B
MIKSELDASLRLIPILKQDIGENQPSAAAHRLDELRSHTSVARAAADDPFWTLAAGIPVLGANFSAVAEVARSADDVANLGIAPLVNVFESLNWDSLVPSSAGTDLEPIRKASPNISAAAHAVGASAQRLADIDAEALLPQVAEPLRLAREQLKAVTGALDASANAAEIAPGMLGADGDRNYLLMIQNNAEVRASGGIPGALAELTLKNGKMTLGAQSSGGDVGVMSPSLSV